MFDRNMPADRLLDVDGHDILELLHVHVHVHWEKEKRCVCVHVCSTLNSLEERKKKGGLSVQIKKAREMK